MAPSFDTLIFDLGDVLFTWSAEASTCVPSEVLHKILRSATWFEYEKGRISEDECYNTVAQQMGLTIDDIRTAFTAARNTLTSRSCMVDLIHELKPGRRIYAMSNISGPDFDVLKSKPSEWDIFDRVFTSASAGERKPNPGFYRHVFEQTGANPQRTIFIDDKPENVLTARSFGAAGIVYDNFENVERTLRNLCGDPVQRARDFMHDNAGNHISFTSNGFTIRENFAQLLILEATGDPSLVEYTKHDGIFNFFRGPGELTTTDFPCDVDTTAIGLTISNGVSFSTKHRVMDEILGLRNADNIPQVYFSSTRPRLDPVVCVNVLTLFYSNGRGAELEETLDWVESILRHRAYLDGTRYYHTAEAFLYFLSRLLLVSSYVQQRLGSLFSERCRERVGMPGDALALAMRIICCEMAGVDGSLDVGELLHMQQLDGGWKEGWFYKYGSADILIANRGLTTSLAINAIDSKKGLKYQNNLAKKTQLLPMKEVKYTLKIFKWSHIMVLIFLVSVFTLVSFRGVLNMNSLT